VTVPRREMIERAIGEIRGVEAVRACLEGEEISEIHVAAAPGSRPKNVARDVRTYLIAALGIDVHHRKISVAVRDGDEKGEAADPESPGNGAGPRIIFRSVNVLVEGLRCEVQVDPTADGRRLVGTASGVPSSLGTERLVARATLSALEQIVLADRRLLIGDLQLTRVGAGEAVVAEVILVRPRHEESLVGACQLGQDRYRSVVFAVLDAVNRVLGRLIPQHWIEYRVEGEGGDHE